MNGRTMKSINDKETKTRMIHIRLPEELHRKLRIRVAESDKTIQDWVVDAVNNELKRQNKGTSIDAGGQ